MHYPAFHTALCQAVALPSIEGGTAPDWVHLLPAGGITTVDNRGPYRVADAAKLVAESLQSIGGQAPLDENHSTDLAAPKGEPSPARGWIKKLEARADGIWGQVDWTDAGKALMADRAYRFISPVIQHLKDGTVIGIARAALTNRPNLRGLTALHSEGADMELLAKLREALGLAADADEAAVMAAITKLKGGTATAMQSALAPIAKAAGLKDDADAAAILGVVTTLAAAGARASGDVVTSLQAELTTVTTRLNELTAATAKDKASAFVDDAIKAGRVGVKPLRDHYIAMHTVDPARVEKEIGAMPILGGSGALTAAPKDQDGKPSLTEADRAVVSLMGIDPEAMKKTRAAEAAHQEARL